MESRQVETAVSAHERLHSTFHSGKTQTLAYRRAQLNALVSFINGNEVDVHTAMRADLGSPAHEVDVYTLLPIYVEINHLQKSLSRLTRPKTLSRSLGAPLQSVPSAKGVVVIFSPSNLPLTLAVRPLAAAIAAGNCVVLKPSEFAPTCEAFLLRLRDVLDPDAFAVVTGPTIVAKQLAALPWGHIMFTGSSAVGRHVMSAAARHLTPVTLELGGKNPAIIARDADLASAAASIVRSRFTNAGQGCLSTDYCLVEEAVHDAFVDALKSATRDAFASEPYSSPSYARLTSRQFDRVQHLVGQTRGHIVLGGEIKATEYYVAPTIVVADVDDVLMADEICGPILPVLRVSSISLAVAEVNRRPASLAIYIFSRDSRLVDAILAQTRSGSACVNDTVVQAAAQNSFLAGFGESGLGGGHGFDEGFYTFTHRRVVLYSQPVLARFLNVMLSPDVSTSRAGRACLRAASGVGFAGRIVPAVGHVGSYGLVAATNIRNSLARLKTCLHKKNDPDS